MSDAPRTSVLAMRRFDSNDLAVRFSADTRPRIAELEQIIDAAWNAAQNRPGRKLIDSPLCRLESFSAGGKLELILSRTSYKPFFGTNLNGAAALARRFGPGALANAVGISCLVQSRDGYLVLGRRNASVAHYPQRVHPFAGMLEPASPMDLFAEARRELAEELHLDADEASDMVGLGIVQDARLMQPEIVLSLDCPRTARELLGRTDKAEHDAGVAIGVTPDALAAALAEPSLTPVATAALMLWGSRSFGSAWFDRQRGSVNLAIHDGKPPEEGA